MTGHHKKFRRAPAGSVPYASEIKKEAEIKTMAVGRIVDAEQLRQFLEIETQI